MADERDIEEILSVLGDEQARTILASVSQETQPAKDLADNLDFSLPTVYRRLERLEKHDLIRSKTELADDGNHYKVFESSFNKTVISLDDGGFEVQIIHEQTSAERLADIWDEL